MISQVPDVGYIVELAPGPLTDTCMIPPEKPCRINAGRSVPVT